MRVERSPRVFAWRTLENAQFAAAELKVRSLGMENAQTPWRTILFIWRTLKTAYFRTRVFSAQQIFQRAPEPVVIAAQPACVDRTDGLRRFDELPDHTDQVFVVDRDDRFKGVLPINGVVRKDGVTVTR